MGTAWYGPAYDQGKPIGSDAMPVMRVDGVP
jgi:hypothetical protein